MPLLFHFFSLELSQSLFEMPYFLASVWMCIHPGRMGAYYTLSEAVTAALSEEAKHFTAQTMCPGRQTHASMHSRIQIRTLTHNAR